MVGCVRAGELFNGAGGVSRGGCAAHLAMADNAGLLLGELDPSNSRMLGCASHSGIMARNSKKRQEICLE